MFHDDLLIRTPAGYEPTARGERLLQELTSILPRLDRLLSGATFDPQLENAVFRIAASDNAAHVLCPLVTRMVRPFSERVIVRFVALHEGAFESIERGRLDLALNADDGHTPDRFHRAEICQDDFVCVVARTSRYPRRLTLKQYLDASHVGIGVLTRRQTIPEQRLLALGLKRTIAVEVPFFTAAIRCVTGTDLMATVPRRLAELERDNRAVKFVLPPKEMKGFRYLTIWHPRVHTDAAHTWLRSIVAAAGTQLTASVRPNRASVPQ